VVRANHVVERLPGGTGWHDGVRAVVEHHTAVGDRAPACETPHGLDAEELSDGIGVGVGAALPLLWGPENHRTSFPAALTLVGFRKLSLAPRVREPGDSRSEEERSVIGGWRRCGVGEGGAIRFQSGDVPLAKNCGFGTSGTKRRNVWAWTGKTQKYNPSIHF
jgi:hypothetical protein